MFPFWYGLATRVPCLLCVCFCRTWHPRCLTVPGFFRCVQDWCVSLCVCFFHHVQYIHDTHLYSYTIVISMYTHLFLCMFIREFSADAKCCAALSHRSTVDIVFTAPPHEESTVNIFFFESTEQGGFGSCGHIQMYVFMTHFSFSGGIYRSSFQTARRRPRTFTMDCNCCRSRVCCLSRGRLRMFDSRGGSSGIRPYVSVVNKIALRHVR